MATVRQKKYLKELVENGGNKYQAAIKAGYSEAVATNTNTKIHQQPGFQEYLDNYLPYKKLFVNLDDLLTQRDNPHVSFLANKLGFELRGHLRNYNNFNVNINNGYQFVIRDEEGNIINQYNSQETPGGDTEESKQEHNSSSS